jgi:NADH dehydrogenase
LTPILTTSIRAVRAIADAGLASVVFFSSNNVAADLGDPVYASLKDAEQKLRATLPHATILRPTLIYGDPRLLTLPRLVRFMRLSPILPIPGNAGTLQQPVHYEDLARVAAVVVRDEALRCKTFAVGGPDIVTKKEMYMLLSRLAGGRRIPVPAPQTLLNLLRAIAPLPLDPAQIARLNVDRIAVPVDSLPAALAPSVRLHEGFRRLIAAMRQDEQAWRAGPDPA